MKSFVILALFAATAAANNYGSAPVSIRVESNSYSAPQQMRSDSYSSGGGYGETQQRNQIPITRFNHDIHGSMSDSVSFETGNGISQSDNTQVVQGRGGSYDDGYGNMVRSEYVLTKNGAFAYTSPEGQHISTTWNADDQGFRAQGDHLPRSVEMPADHAEAHRQAQASAQSSSSSYGGNSYSAPAMRSSYEAPAASPPVIRVQSYDAPAVRSSYEAPAMRSSYEAPSASPVIRVQSYDAPAPVRSSY